MAEPSPTPRTRVRRLPQRAAYDEATIHAILDNGLVCHIGFVHEGQPFVLPRSAFHHSMNYRSVVILGVATEVTDDAERLYALEAIVEHVNPGRWAEVRPPDERERKATMVLRLPIAEAAVPPRPLALATTAAGTPPPGVAAPNGSVPACPPPQSSPRPMRRASSRA